MISPDLRIRAFLESLATRWRRLAGWRVAASIAWALTILWAAALLAWWVVGRLALANEIAIVGITALCSLTAVAVIWRRRPASPRMRDLARLVEERVPSLEDRLATSADLLAQSDTASARSRVGAALLDDTAARIDAIAPDAIVSDDVMRRAMRHAVLASVVLIVAGALLIGPVSRTLRATWLFASPSGLTFHVEPGDVRLRPGTPLTIRVRAEASTGSLVPDLEARMGDAVRRAPMTPEGGARFSVTFGSVPASFTYRATLAGRHSPDYRVVLLEPPGIAGIDLTYEFPAFTRMAARTETDSGDVYAPAGTRVRVVVRARTTTTPIASASLSLRSGTVLPLTAGSNGTWAGDILVSKDDGYRVRLTDTDGLENENASEYFVRMMDDRPPNVRILRPGGDRQVTPLEEVDVEVQAEDDHGVSKLELVYAARGGVEHVVPLGGNGEAVTVTGRHTIALEELDVRPGDFVTFYARATDVGRGRRPSVARSDIFFLEVTPFADTFALAQSQAMAAGGQAADELVRLQKDIIVGTWKLDRRTSAGGAAPPADDLRALARVQGTLRGRTEAAAARVTAGGPVLHPPDGPSAGGNGAESPLTTAAQAMARAEQALTALDPRKALPAEMEALNGLLKAQSDAQRKQVTRQAGGGGGGRAQQDLSNLFDRELQRQQQTNYETPKTAEERREDTRDDALDRVRALARRQEALTRQQDDIAKDRKKLDPDEVRRRLERLTREQSDLRRDAELLAEQLQQAEQRRGQQASQSGTQSGQSRGGQSGQESGRQSGQQSGRSGQSGATAAQARALRDASQDMGGAASELRREDPEGARPRSARALDRLRELERSLQEAAPDEHRRAVGDAQLEARQMGARQRQLNETARSAAAADDADTRRRLAGEQEQLAGRVEALGRRLGELQRQGDNAEQNRLAAAGKTLDAADLAGRMRSIAKGLQQGRPASESDTGREVARRLDRVADQVGESPAGRGRDDQRLSDRLSQTRELRERLADLDRQIRETEGARQTGGTGSGSDGQGASGRDSQPKDGAASDARATKTAELRRQYMETLRRAAESDDQLRNVVAGTGGAGSTPVAPTTMATAAPGTEAFKQDYAQWESLHQGVALGLERLEVSLSQQLIDKASKDRLRSGSADQTPPEYADSVDRYFRALAEEPH